MFETIQPFLSQLSIFSAFSEEEQKRLLEKGQIVEAPAQKNLVIEGEATRGFYLFLQGTGSLYKNDPVRNAMIRFAGLEVGSIFGETSLFDPSPRSATVVIDTPCKLYVLEESVFSQFLAGESENLQLRFYKKCVEEVLEQFRRQHKDYRTAQLLLWKHVLQNPAPSSVAGAPTSAAESEKKEE